MAEADIPFIQLTYKYRLLPTKAQHAALERILDDQKILYNAALQERIDCWHKTGKGITLYEQQNSLTIIRDECEGWDRYPVKLQRGTLVRLDRAFRTFFRKLKKGEKAGFPRYKGRGSFTSFQFVEFSGIMLIHNKVRFKGMPGPLRIHMHRPLPSSKIYCVSFKRDIKGWWIYLVVAVPVAQARTPVRRVGIDLGITSLAALSTGEMIANRKLEQRMSHEMRRRQRALTRCKWGSNRRKKVKLRVARLYHAVRDARATYLHQISAALVQKFDLVAVEKLRVDNLMRSSFARDVSDASWGRIRTNLAYKALKAGVQFVEVDPCYTSQTCPECGLIKRKKLSQRIHRCECGCVLDRDVAAAKVILNKGVAALGLGKLLATAA